MVSTVCGYFTQPEGYQEWVEIDLYHHRCCECGCDLPPKKRYNFVVGRWYGAYMTFVTCLFCAGVRNDIKSYGYCTPHAELWDWIKEELEND